MTLEKSFSDECQELGEFRKAYIKKHNLKVLGMVDACRLWREHQGDVAAKDTVIKDQAKALTEAQERSKELEDALENILCIHDGNQSRARNMGETEYARYVIGKIHQKAKKALLGDKMKKQFAEEYYFVRYDSETGKVVKRDLKDKLSRDKDKGE